MWNWISSCGERATIPYGWGTAPECKGNNVGIGRIVTIHVGSLGPLMNKYLQIATDLKHTLQKDTSQQAICIDRCRRQEYLFDFSHFSHHHCLDKSYSSRIFPAFASHDTDRIRQTPALIK